MSGSTSIPSGQNTHGPQQAAQAQSEEDTEQKAGKKEGKKVTPAQEDNHIPTEADSSQHHDDNSIEDRNREIEATQGKNIVNENATNEAAEKALESIQQLMSDEHLSDQYKNRIEKNCIDRSCVILQHLLKDINWTKKPKKVFAVYQKQSSQLLKQFPNLKIGIAIEPHGRVQLVPLSKSIDAQTFNDLPQLLETALELANGLKLQRKTDSILEKETLKSIENVEHQMQIQMKDLGEEQRQRIEAKLSTIQNPVVHISINSAQLWPQIEPIKTTEQKTSTDVQSSSSPSLSQLEDTQKPAPNSEISSPKKVLKSLVESPNARNALFADIKNSGIHKLKQVPKHESAIPSHDELMQTEAQPEPTTLVEGTALTEMDNKQLNVFMEKQLWKGLTTATECEALSTTFPDLKTHQAFQAYSQQVPTTNTAIKQTLSFEDLIIKRREREIRRLATHTLSDSIHQSADDQFDKVAITHSENAFFKTFLVYLTQDQSLIPDNTETEQRISWMLKQDGLSEPLHDAITEAIEHFKSVSENDQHASLFMDHSVIKALSANPANQIASTIYQETIANTRLSHKKYSHLASALGIDTRFMTDQTEADLALLTDCLFAFILEHLEVPTSDGATEGLLQETSQYSLMVEKDYFQQSNV